MPRQRAARARLPSRLRELRRTWTERTHQEDAWPFTTRVLPWGVALVVLMTCLVPFDAIELAVSAPIDLTLDRLVLGPLALIWVVCILTGAHRLQRLHFGALGYAVAALIGAGVLSILVNLQTLNIANELPTAIKRCAFLASYGLVFVLFATSVRRSEVFRLLRLYVLAATVTALGVIYDYRIGTNLFYQFANTVFIGPFTVADAPIEELSYLRQVVAGPTGHPLAVTMLVSFALPFSVIGILRNRTGIRNLAYIAITAILLAGAVSTLRRSALIVPLASFLVLTLAMPREMGRLIPVGLLVVVMIQGIAPSALGGVKSQFFGQPLSENASVQGRTEDYNAVGPDIWAEPFFGRGVGSYVPDNYRFIDNQYLLSWIDTGALGVVAYLAVLAAMLATSRRLVRSGDTETRRTGIAIAAAATGYFVASALFDILSFNHAPYILFALAGLAIAATPREEPVPPAPA